MQCFSSAGCSSWCVSLQLKIRLKDQDKHAVKRENQCQFEMIKTRLFFLSLSADKYKKTDQIN